MALALSTIVIAVLAILLGFLLIPTDDKIEGNELDYGDTNENPPTDIPEGGN